MWGTAIRLLRKYWLEVLWVVVSALSIATVYVLTQWETIPFHVVWVSLTLLCCFRLWSFRTTAAVLFVVTTVSGAALFHVVTSGGDAGYDELAEVPMMASIYAVAVWGAWRREDARQKLERSVERERDFVRDASHLLRTPITVAAGHTELIRESGGGTGIADDAVTVLEELRHLSTISDQLLLLYSADDPNFLARRQVDVGSLVLTTANRWEATASRDWQVAVDAEGSIVADLDRLSLALDCLVENALNATHDGDRISIACRAEGESAVFEVSDSGVGISPEEQGRIFERFSGPRSRTNGRGGTGLGLRIVKAMAEAHDGCVEVESELGAGATFRIRLNGFRPRGSVELVANGFEGTSAVTAPQRPVV